MDERKVEQSNDRKRSRGFSGITKRKLKGCVVKSCKEDHPPWVCQSFKNLSVPERKELISKSGRCYRCLAMGHQSKNCTRERRCGIDGCSSNQHSRFLHVEKGPKEREDHQETALPNNEAKEPSTERTHIANQADHISLMVIPAIISNERSRLKINAMLDPCSTGTYITESAAQQLKLQGQRQSLTISGTGGSEVKKQSARVELFVSSLDGRFTSKVQANVLDNITGDTPAIRWSELKEKWPHLKAIPFDDISRRRQIDVLIGSDHPIFHRIRREIHGFNVNDPVARLTSLGWVCFGPTLPSFSRSNSRTHSTRTYRTSTACQEHENQTTNDILRRFWELDSLGMSDHPTQQQPTADEQTAIDQVERTLSFKNGQYEIGIPWKKGEPKFSNNYELAFSRLKNLEKSLQRKDPKIREAYKKIIEDYSVKGYVRKATQNGENEWFLPHFPVVREDKSTTKVRVVFDAAAKYAGKCLNDAVLPGPKLQLEIVDVLLRFRQAPVAISADIAEMFLQVRLREDDQSFHRFLWRDLEAWREPDVYEFLQLPFGNSASPFCAQHVLQSHSRSNAAEYPEAAETIKNSMYVDDVLDSRETVEETRELQKQLSTVLKNGGFNLRKWSSNQPSVLVDVPTAERLSNIRIEDPSDLSHKTLGVLWRTSDDVFTFHVEDLKSDRKATKRNVLRAIASLFDPLQFLAPFTTRAKMLMQEIWQAGVEWDEILPFHLHAKWTQWASELAELPYVRIPRCLRLANPQAVYLHVFSDSSEKAYATVAYLVCHYDAHDAATSCIIMAKSRVSPIKAVTIPRLELMGAVLSTRIAKNIQQVLTNIIRTTYWTDSTNVLHWIRSESRSFKQFVANRVGEIHRATDPDQWRHVPGELNPADLPSRGTSASELVNSRLWIEGPEFLKADEATWPDKLPSSTEKPDQAEEKRAEVHASSSKGKTTDETFLDPTNFSSLRRLVRVTAWMQRFLANCRLDKRDRALVDTLGPLELTKAEIWWLRKTQTQSFPMGEKQQSLTRLNPKKDKDGLLRAHGRLQNAGELPYDTKYPVLLPKDHPLTKLVISDRHERLGHGTGTEHLLTELRTRFWVIKGRRVVRNVVESCPECRRLFSAKPAGQMMAPLPEARVTSSLRAFERVGVDYAGPFLTKQGRRKAKAKRYLCLFTCLSTRAVHLEMAYSLDTCSFINAFIRMTSRRGTPAHVISDNGTNFTGAEREMRELLQEFDEERIINETTKHHKIRWDFNPPSSPHFGGVFESMIKSSKKALRAILRDADVTDEELETAIVGAEGQLNSRPITYVSSDVDDVTPLTPNHFLVGQLGGQYAPEAFDVEEGRNLRSRWRQVQQLLGQFWSRWRKEFLPSLNKRGKWFHPQRNLKEGDVVLVVDTKAKRGEWPLGRVMQVHPGKDGLVRVVQVKVGKHVYTRPVHRLCPLECDGN